ncbi:electron transfer flavoprotein subunit beta/FixA family protein [Fusibacter paucivorans]|uniref:Electron transfer flavoprotein small subunit n=1 Tax=Fusibacter paucivorans TaxID=76009 RepID=A0ABS5PVM5_9FIRM|nr:electron transfer flavoprotein subunit beta/FixA family protein [Fusibacter paucivorans]MBS7528576.1 electron transfer flavoprotein subunit beta/FixA family protein [Fusibacter paucivorans]
MKIVVLVKQVPDLSGDIKIDPKTKNLDRRDSSVVINPYDLQALTLALQLKQQFNAETCAISMGPQKAEMALYECLAMGIDEAVLISDRAFVGSDTLATTLIIAQAIRKKIPDVTMILCGKHAVDAETGIVGPGVAERMGLPCVSNVCECPEIKNGKARVRRQSDTGYQTVSCALPAVFTIAETSSEPNYIHMNNIKKASNAHIETMTLASLQLERSKVGIEGSPTVVGSLNLVEMNKETVMLTGDQKEAACRIAALLQKTAKGV